MPSGGKRSGAGRKPAGHKKKEVLSVRLSPYLIDRLKAEGNPGTVLETILSEYFMEHEKGSPETVHWETTQKIYNKIKSCCGAYNQQLISIRELRASLPGVRKSAFDSAVLELANSGKLFLHRHIHPIRLNQTERSEFVEDNQGVYVGIVLRDTVK